MTSSGDGDALIKKAERYIDSAEILRKDGDFDSATSRLYYAMFYCAEALLATRGYYSSTHRGVIAGFGQHFVKTGLMPKELHRWLQEAFEQRQIGDYEPVSGITEVVLTDLQSKARQFLIEVKAFIDREASGVP